MAPFCNDQAIILTISKTQPVHSNSKWPPFFQHNGRPFKIRMHLTIQNTGTVHRGSALSTVFEACIVIFLLIVLVFRCHLKSSVLVRYLIEVKLKQCPKSSIVLLSTLVRHAMVFISIRISTSKLHILTLSSQHRNKHHSEPSLCLCLFTGITRLQFIRPTEREPSIHVKDFHMKAKIDLNGLTNILIWSWTLILFLLPWKGGNWIKTKSYKKQPRWVKKMFLLSVQVQPGPSRQLRRLPRSRHSHGHHAQRCRCHGRCPSSNR